MGIHNADYGPYRAMTAEFIDCMGSDLRIANAARVSMGKWHGIFQDSDARLIRYLAREKHWTPFAHAQLTFRITAPIFVARQLARHTVGLVWNEVSRRYVDDVPEFFMPDAWRHRPVDNVKQGSGDALDEESQRIANVLYEEAIGDAERAYRDILLMGICPEQARMVLPQSLLTSWIWTGSLAAFSRIVGLRKDAHTQVETRAIADAIDVQCEQRFPIAWPALMGVEHDA